MARSKDTRGRYTMPRTCEECGAPFMADPSEVKRGYGRYCGKPCSAQARAKTARPIAERFWENVNQNGPTIRPELGPCWLWTGRKNPQGYGVITIGSRTDGSRKQCPATHIAIEVQHGIKMPEGMDGLHRCDNPPCVRGEHLFVGDAHANVQDMLEKGRANPARGELSHNGSKTHCPQGHEYIPENTRVRRGARECLICAREHLRESAQRRKERDPEKVRADARERMRRMRERHRNASQPMPHVTERG